MKKGKLIVSILASLITIGAIFAFKANEALPGNLYYFNDQSQCVRAPCSTTNSTDNICLLEVYTTNACSTAYTGDAWTSNGGN